MLLFEEYKRICGPEMLKLPEKDLRRAYEILTTLADIVVKNWLEEKKNGKKLSEEEKQPEDSGTLTQGKLW